MKPTPPCDAGPVLVLCGDADTTTPPRHAEAVADATADSRLVILENAGHFPFAGASPAVAEEMIRFLDEVL
jgi:pimeloyl-ACP methyl ester carboxylesterase